jgi:RimJ/RimL family protein N-acetyltransferase
MKNVYQKGNEIFLRYAEYSDLNDIYNWRNDRDTRKASFNMEPIEIDEHIKWFNKSLIDPKNNIFIIIDRYLNKLGQIRFDRKNNEAEINITIDPKFRNKGIGSLALSKSSKQYLNNYDVDVIIAKVKKNNNRSLKAFRKAGFIIFKEFQDYIELRFER